MNKNQIEKALEIHGKYLASLSRMEKAELSNTPDEGAKWRIANLANDGLHGMAGGSYFRNLSDVSDHVSAHYTD